MGEWITSTMLLNKSEFSETSLKAKVIELLLEAKDKLQHETVAVLYFNPSKKWAYLYSEDIVTAPTIPGMEFDYDNVDFETFFAQPQSDYEEGARILSKHFETTVICNHVYDGDELLMALSGEKSALYVWRPSFGRPSDYVGEYSMLANLEFEFEKWQPLLECNEDEVLRVLADPDELETDRYKKLGRCLGYDERLWFYDYRCYEEIGEMFPEKLKEYSQIIIKSD